VKTEEDILNDRHHDAEMKLGDARRRGDLDAQATQLMRLAGVWRVYREVRERTGRDWAGCVLAAMAAENEAAAIRQQIKK
jgi:hypothetical protein